MQLRTVVCTLFAAGSLLAREPVHARHGMVVTQEPLAADVGVSVLKAGGNAVDAAVAIAFALAVTHPSAGNIGGGGFMLVRLADGRTNFLDFRERAPAQATRDMYLDVKGKVTKDSLVGWRASGVPGTVAGLELAHKKYGRKAWPELVQPAVTLAEKGFPVSYSLSQSLSEESHLLSQFPESKRVFLSASYGDPLVQAELGATLKRIRDDGAADFYQGETAKKLASEEKSHSGLITLEDLKSYQVVERTPLRGRYKDCDIIAAPPPSSGGIGILQMLGML
jgi:gamma-glutamyltranspeptidase / glutathione hydrolase